MRCRGGPQGIPNGAGTNRPQSECPEPTGCCPTGRPGVRKETMMEFKQVVAKRHSVRDFTDQPVSSQDLVDIVRTAQQAPSWVNSQPWVKSFGVV